MVASGTRLCGMFNAGHSRTPMAYAVMIPLYYAETTERVSAVAAIALGGNMTRQQNAKSKRAQGTRKRSKTDSPTTEHGKTEGGSTTRDGGSGGDGRGKGEGKGEGTGRAAGTG